MPHTRWSPLSIGSTGAQHDRGTVLDSRLSRLSRRGRVVASPTADRSRVRGAHEQTRDERHQESAPYRSLGAPVEGLPRLSAIEPQGAEDLPICPVCDGRSTKHEENAPSAEVRACLSCGVSFAWPCISARTSFYDETLDSMVGWGGAGGELRRISMTPRYRAFFSLVGNGDGRSLLDLACGLGGFLNVAARRGFEPHGIEQSAVGVRFARERLGLANVRIGSIYEPNADGDQFDVVTLMEVLEHLERPRDGIRAAWRYLKPGGLLFLSTPDADRLQVRLGRRSAGDYPPKHLTRWKSEVLAKFLGDEGWADVDVRHTPLDASVFWDVVGRRPVGAPATRAALEGRPARGLRRGFSLLASAVLWVSAPAYIRFGAYGHSLVAVAKKPTSPSTT